ncbi:magnesium/cobalt transporter CorA [Candidatus Bipolaricaulota bacterium]|nr:magnesium/cobalt transporter CorA [Candidatus Bipolaricaulota bacterium]TFH09059.1 MAG: magnesium/cobalt transporter CorA [Candidatus Atribacteria bacterium]
MARFFHKSSEKAGQTPGTAVYVGAAKHETVTVERYEFDEVDLECAEAVPLGSVQAPRDSQKTLWINVDGVHEVDLVQALGTIFELHPLAIEDIAHTGQRPKVEDYGNHALLVLRMLRWNEKDDQIDDEQVSLAIGPSWVLSFQERKGDVFNPIRDRLKSSRGRIRKMGADYLLYALVDAIVDHYFVILETLGDRIETLGEQMAEDPNRKDLVSIRHLKRELLFMRKSVWPLREVLSSLQRDGAVSIHEETVPYFRDVYDHTIQIIDTVETFRDMVSGLMDLYLSSISNRMNEVMKVLTIIATIFIPLTFVAGLYGMNFAYIPELQWRYGYFGALGLMGVIACGMLIYFRRRKWL